MNELTRQIQGIMIPKAALIAYELQNEVYAKASYYLELRPIDGKGRMRAAVPVTYEFNMRMFLKNIKYFLYK